MTAINREAAIAAFSACPACRGTGVSSQHPYTGEATECECRAILTVIKTLPAPVAPIGREELAKTIPSMRQLRLAILEVWSREGEDVYDSQTVELATLAADAVLARMGGDREGK